MFGNRPPNFAASDSAGPLAVERDVNSERFTHSELSHGRYSLGGPWRPPWCKKTSNGFNKLAVVRG